MTMADPSVETSTHEPADALTDPKILENFLSVLVHDVKAPIRHMRMHLGDINDAGIALTQAAQNSASANASANASSNTTSEASEALSQALNNADKSMHRLKRIADKLGEYHISLLPPQPDLVPLQALCQAEQRKLQTLIHAQGATITIDTLPSLMGDREQLGLIVNNLLENALLYRGEAAPTIHISTEKTNGYQRLIIQDNGQGIPENQLEQVCKPFVRLHAKDLIEGAGLGLWIAKTLAEKHYMQLILENNPATDDERGEKTTELSSNQATDSLAPTSPNRGCRAILQWSL